MWHRNNNASHSPAKRSLIMTPGSRKRRRERIRKRWLSFEGLEKRELLTGLTQASDVELDLGASGAAVLGTSMSGEVTQGSELASSMNASSRNDVPRLTAPGPVTSDLTPTVTWTAVAGARGYQLYVTNMTTGQPVLHLNVWGTSREMPQLTANHAHRAWVVAFDTWGRFSA